ncbi:hypothetical protein HDV62DRAFT_384548 [Trichoderma sp. SZMC 28011]
MWGSSRSPSGNLSLELRLQRAGRKTGERIRYVAASGQKRDSKEGGWRRTSERAGERSKEQTQKSRFGYGLGVWSDPVRSWSTWPLRFLFLGRGEAPGRPGGAPIVWNCTVWM